MATRDPQTTTGAPPRPVPPPCTCGHGAALHAVPKAGTRAACSTYAYGRWCGCKRYEAAT